MAGLRHISDAVAASAATLKAYEVAIMAADAALYGRWVRTTCGFALVGHKSTRARATCKSGRATV
jgi:hypothetical protein